MSEAPADPLREELPAIQVRRFPYPYRALLAICSDLDETPDAETYFELMRFLNTTATTTMGQGVGLEVGNSIFFDMPPGHFSYWNTGEKDREKIRALIRSGHIDCLHSFGDAATTRAHAERALQELEQHDCRLRVWVDHAVAPTNFGSDIMQGHGDDPNHPAYHADLTIRHGVRYVWRGRVTSVIGQDVPLGFGGIADWSHPAGSVRTVGKELAKQTLARCGHAKYALHRGNQTLSSVRLRDGTQTLEFMRCNPHWKGVDTGDTGAGIGEVLTKRFLDQLVARGGSSILYTHLGKLDRSASRPGFNAAAIAAWRRLAEYQRAGKILVTTTRRLLDFVSMRNQVKISLNHEDGGQRIQVHTSTGGMEGLTLYVPAPGKTRLFSDGGNVVPCVVNPADESGRKSISVPFAPLSFP